MYIANHYVKINGKMYTCGEIIEEELTEKQKEWLTKAGAIHEEAPAAVHSDSQAIESAEDDHDEYADEITEIDILDGLVADEIKGKPAKRESAKKQSERRKAK